MRLPNMSPEARSIKVTTTDLDELIMSIGDKFGSGDSYQIRQSRQSGSGPLVLLQSRLNPASSSSDPSLNKKNREESVRVSSTEKETSTSVDSHSTKSTTDVEFQRASGPEYLSEERPNSKPVKLSYLPRSETSLSNAETSVLFDGGPRKSALNVIDESGKFVNKDDLPGNQNTPMSSKTAIRNHETAEIQRVNLVLGRVSNHHEHAMKREAHWQNQDPPFFAMRYPPSFEGQHAEPLISPHQVDPQLPGYFGGGGYTLDPYNSTTTESGAGATHPYNVVGLLLAAASVIFIIIGIAFVFTRVRRRKPLPDEPDSDPNALEMVETSKPDPYAQWLNMPEEEPPKPALKKQVKTVVRTVSRKMSLTPKTPGQVFTPGVPEHLRYQLKQIYVY